jgi:low affinity Fe/Cu permease
MIWLILFTIAALVWTIMERFAGLNRLGHGLSLAVLLIAMIGYAVQGSPNLAGATMQTSVGE